MPLTTITVTGSYPAGAGAGVATGYITLTPTARIVNATGHAIIPQLPIQVPLQLGAFSLPGVVTTDNAGLNPTGWAWAITETINGVPGDTWYAFIPSSYGATVDLAQLAEAQAGPVITAYASLAASNTFTEPNTFGDGLTVAGALTLDGTTIGTPPGGTTEYLRADGTWDVPAGGGGGVQIGGDLGGTNSSPQVTATHLAAPLPAAQGGTGAASLSAAGIITTTGAASTVQPGTGYGASPSVGTDTTYAREDHQHGTVALTSAAPATTEAIGQAAATGTATTPARADHVHPLAAAGTPGNSAVGDSATAGVAATFAASDHRHGREGFAAPTAQTGYGAAPATGTATTLAHSDHAHGTPALTVTAPATTEAIGTGAALGTATLPALADHVHPMAAAATPTTSAVTDTAATGAATTFAASNHVHGREGFGAVTALAAFPTASATGTAATVAHSDHVHGAPALPSASVLGGLLIANSLSDVASVSGARTNLGLGGAAVLNVGAIIGTVAAGDDSRITGAAQKSANLSDLASTATARTNLGLGAAAVANIGTGAGTVAAGNDTRITGALQSASNLSDLASPSTARGSLGLGGAATLNVGTTTGTVAAGDDSRITGAAQKAQNLSDLTSTATARANLGLGTSAQQNAGTITGALAEVLPVYACAAAGGSQLTAAVLILNLLRPQGPILVTNLGIWLTLAGVTASGANGLALYTEAGVLIDQTADLSTAFASLGYTEAPLSLGTQQLAANTSYYVGVLAHFSGTAPKAASSLAGQAIPVIKGHYVSLTKSATATFPASFTPSALTTSTAAYYMTLT